jgi:hypothetical protein
MSANSEALQAAKRLMGKMVRYVQIYEAGVFGDPDVFEITLTPTQINDLKAEFAIARTACKTELDKVEG